MNFGVPFVHDCIAVDAVHIDVRLDSHGGQIVRALGSDAVHGNGVRDASHDVHGIACVRVLQIGVRRIPRDAAFRNDVVHGNGAHGARHNVRGIVRVCVPRIDDRCIPRDVVLRNDVVRGNVVHGARHDVHQIVRVRIPQIEVHHISRDEAVRSDAIYFAPPSHDYDHVDRQWLFVPSCGAHAGQQIRNADGHFPVRRFLSLVHGCPGVA